jgi:hypothetical protein
MNVKPKLKYVSPENAAAVDRLIDAAVKSVTKADLIVERLGNTVNQAAVVEWFVKFGGLIVAEDASGFGSWQGPKFIAEHLDDAKATMWYDLRKQNAFAGYNAEAEVHKFIAKYKGMRDKLNEGKLSDEDAKKVDMHINITTLDTLMSLCKMELIVSPDDSAANGEAQTDNVVEHPAPRQRKAAHA